MEVDQGKNATDNNDEFMNKFSRQNAAFGAEVTLKLTKMQALVVGCGGVGVETTKNLILQGLGGVTLCDQSDVKIQDLGSNFFLTESDVGKKMAPTLVPKFKELNPFCKVKAETGGLTAEVVAQHTVMIVCELMPLQELLKWDDFCRSKSIPFIYAFTGGAFASVFVDFGADHIVTDPDGQQPMVRLVDSIENGPDALVRITVPDGQAPGTLPNDAYVEFSDVKGCDGLMTHQEPGPTGELVTGWKTSSKSDDPVNTIRISDTSSLPPYISGGLLTEKKVPRPYPFRALSEVLADPGFPFDSMVGTDMVNFGSELQSHLALHALLALRQDGKADADAGAMVAKAKELMSSRASKVELEVDEELFAKFVRHFNCPLQPLCAFLGGVVAQEVVKCAGKYTPIPGFLHFNAMEALPAEAPADSAPRGCRYDQLAAVYGHSFIEKLGNLRYFMVGCGALGCEFLKNFALNGVCCGDKGMLDVTDNDRIELSNLTRQFLFREHNVGQAKSRAASDMARIMNPNMKLNAQELLVATKSEDTFNDAFWMGLDGVCNALDNMEARFYVDEQCVKYLKPLLESGTMGPAGNIDPIVPFKTPTYRDGGQAAADGGIPMCTLRNFPHLPDHCIEWSRDIFELLFVKSLKQVKKFLEDPDTFINERATSSDDAQSIFEVRGLLSLLAACEKPSMESAAQLAFDYFHLLFRDKIQDLINAFPEDARLIDKDTKQDKGPFWSGHKRFPKPAQFDGTKETHWRFHVATTALFAALLKVIPAKQENDDGYCKDMRSQAWAASSAQALKVPEYVAGAVNTDGDKTGSDEGNKTDSKAQLNSLLARLKTYSGIKLPDLEEADFEKDDDFNFHIDVITQASNLRADNYFIANSDFQKVKLIAGRIIPAVATTTAAVCGLVMLELFKIALGKESSTLRTRQIGLAVNTFTSFETQEPIRHASGSESKKPKASDLPPEAFDESGGIKAEYIEVEHYAAYPEKHSIWDKLVVPSATMTLEGFKQWLLQEHKLKLKNWSFVLGWKRQEDEEGKEMRVPFSTQIFPPPVQIDAALLPPLESDQGGAMRAIMGSATIPQAQKQKYLQAWQQAKRTGEMPKSDSSAVQLDTSLKDVLHLMSKKADAAMQEGTLFAKWGTAISGLDNRRFWIIPADQTPSCETVPADDTAEPLDVRYLAAMQIPLA